MNLPVAICCVTLLLGQTQHGEMTAVIYKPSEPVHQSLVEPLFVNGVCLSATIPLVRFAQEKHYD